MCARAQVLVACTGAGKADGVKMALGGSFADGTCPVGLLGGPNTAWLVDKPAVSPYLASLHA